MQFCIKFVVLNRSYSTNTQPIWKRRYPTGAWKSQVCSYFNLLFNFAFLIDIFDNIVTYSPYSPYYVTRILANGSAVNLTQFYINFFETEHQIDVLYGSFNAWDISGFIRYPFSFFLYSLFNYEKKNLSNVISNCYIIYKKNQ